MSYDNWKLDSGREDDMEADEPDNCGCGCHNCCAGFHRDCTMLVPCVIARTCGDCKSDPCKCDEQIRVAFAVLVHSDGQFSFLQVASDGITDGKIHIPTQEEALAHVFREHGGGSFWTFGRSSASWAETAKRTREASFYEIGVRNDCAY